MARQQQKHFPRHSMVAWNDNEYRVEEIKRQTDGNLWSLIEPTDPDLQTKWVPNFELKDLEIPSRVVRDPAPNKNFETMATEAAGEIRARAVVKLVLLHVTGMEFTSAQIPQEAIDAVTEYGEEQRLNGLEAAEAGF